MLYSDKEGDYMAFDKGKYDKGYAKEHITRKFIPFNDTVSDDKELLAWLDTVGNVTKYVKNLIREDMLAYRVPHLPEKEKNRIVIPCEDNYSDDEATMTAVQEGHTIRHFFVGTHEVSYDVDARKVLRSINWNGCQNGCQIGNAPAERPEE